MSVYSAGRIKQIMDKTVQEALTPLVNATRATEQVERWLCDDFSKTSYRNELVFMALRNMLRQEKLALDYASNIGVDEWNAAIDRVMKMRDGGEVPRLHMPPGHDWVEKYAYASTFIYNQYSYGNVGPKDKIMLDLGAFCGDTSVWAVIRGAEHVYAFEPNPKTMFYLNKNAEQFGRGRITPVPLGVGEAPGKLSIEEPDANNLGGSRLSKARDGAPGVDVCTIDGWCAEKRITPGFIKMDLEGAEISALKGAEQTIRRNRPQLAISLYHSLPDMWTIPLLIKQIVPEYKFWCRKNALYVEFVLYASV